MESSSLEVSPKALPEPQASMKHTPTALLVIDVQNDFIDGSLAVPGAKDIIPPTLELIRARDVWTMIVASQDYHPAGHISFASKHGKEPFQEIQVAHPINTDTTVPQMLWPDHCIAGTRGSEFDADVARALDDARRGSSTSSSSSLNGSAQLVHVVQKGQDPQVDGYSAFSKNHYVGFTPLVRALAARGIERLVLCGLATDYCVHATARDARKFGFDTILVRSAVAGVDAGGAAQALAELERWGCAIAPDVPSALELARRR